MIGFIKKIVNQILSAGTGCNHDIKSHGGTMDSHVQLQCSHCNAQVHMNPMAYVKLSDKPEALNAAFEMLINAGGKDNA